MMYYANEFRAKLETAAEKSSTKAASHTDDIIRNIDDLSSDEDASLRKLTTAQSDYTIEDSQSQKRDDQEEGDDFQIIGSWFEDQLNPDATATKMSLEGGAHHDSSSAADVAHKDHDELNKLTSTNASKTEIDISRIHSFMESVRFLL